MKTRNLWLICGSLSMILLLLLACGPSAAPGPSPAPTAKPTAAVTPTPSPSASPTSKPTATSSAAPVSFAGKTVTFVVPFAPGGATDIIGRMYARYMPQYLPGKPIVVVRNIPAGATTVGANYVYMARPDGLTALVVGVTVTISQLLGMSAVKYDLNKMPSSVGVASGGLVFIRPGIIEKPEDLIKAKGIIIGSSPGAGTYLFVCAKELMNFPTDRITFAYSGGAEARRAFFSGEVNMSFDPTATYQETLAPLVQKGEVMLLFQTGVFNEKGELARDEGLPPIPTIKELYEKIFNKPPSGMVWDAYKASLAASKGYDKGLSLPPGTPDNIVRVYWDAAEKMIADPEFRKMADPLVGKGARWSAGQTWDKEFKMNLQMDPKIVEWFRATLPKYGIVIE